MVNFFPDFFHASIIFSASSVVAAIGFSHITCLPASKDATVIGQCATLGVQT